MKNKSNTIENYQRMQNQMVSSVCIRYVFVAQRQPEWMGMLTIFEYTTWIAFYFVLIVSAISWFCFGCATPEKMAHKDFGLCFLNSWCVSLGISTNNRPVWNPLRIFFVLLALYSINVTTIYTSKLIGVFTNPPYQEQIDTIEEIIDSKLPIGKLNKIIRFSHFN